MSEATPSERARELEMATLTRHLEQMAVDGGDHVGILKALASALFPDGMPDRGKLTWGERSANAAQGDDTPETAEEKLRAAEARYRTLVEQIPAVTFLAVMGEGKNEMYVSPHIEQMLGFSQQEWLEAPFLWYWQLHPEDRQVLNDEFARGCRTGGPFKAECRFFARDGRTVWVHGEARIVKDEKGRPSLLQGIAFDITDSKRAERVLVDQATRKARADEELAIARRVQTSILPRKLAIDGLELSATMVPATEVGGDYYDVHSFPGGGFLAIGDVSGHGLNSGLVMLMVQSAMAALLRVNPSAKPSEVLAKLNAVLFDNIRARLHHDDHVTLSLLRYETSGEFVFAGAHEEILVYRRATRTVDRVTTPGVWLGGMSDITAVTVDSTVRLQAGDVMLLYTDGITEARDAKREQFDIDRLTETFKNIAELSCDRIRDHILTAVRRWMRTQEDDMTLLVARYIGTTTVAPPAPPSVAAPAAARGENGLFATSVFDGVERTLRPEFTHVGDEGAEFAAQGYEGAGFVGIRLEGTAELTDQTTLHQLFANLHERARTTKTAVAEVDIRPLKFMASSCLKEFVTLIAALLELPDGERYRLRIVGDPLRRWQRTSVVTLFAFGKEVFAVR